MAASDLEHVDKGVPINVSGTFANGNPVLIEHYTQPQRLIQIQNIGMMNMGFSFLTITPAVGAPGTFTLAPGATWQSPYGFIPDADLYVVGVAGQSYTAWFF